MTVWPLDALQIAFIFHLLEVHSGCCDIVEYQRWSWTLVWCFISTFCALACCILPLLYNIMYQPYTVCVYYSHFTAISQSNIECVLGECTLADEALSPIWSQSPSLHRELEAPEPQQASVCVSRHQTTVPIRHQVCSPPTKVRLHLSYLSHSALRLQGMAHQMRLQYCRLLNTSPNSHLLRLLKKSSSQWSRERGWQVLLRRIREITEMQQVASDWSRLTATYIQQTTFSPQQWINGTSLKWERM